MLFRDIPVAGMGITMSNEVSLIVTFCELLVTKRTLLRVAEPPVKLAAAVSERVMISPFVPLIGVRAKDVEVRRKEPLDCRPMVST